MKYVNACWLVGYIATKLHMELLHNNLSQIN